MPKVLTVDDSRAVRMLVSKNAKEMGLEVDEAEDGQQGLSKTSEGSYDLIVLDVTNPPNGRRSDHHERRFLSAVCLQRAVRELDERPWQRIDAWLSAASVTVCATGYARQRDLRPCHTTHPAQMMTRQPSRTRIPTGQGRPDQLSTAARTA